MSHVRLSADEIAELGAVRCGECGGACDPEGVVFVVERTPVWARCSSCVSAWGSRTARSLDAETAHRLVANGAFFCSDCGDLIRPEGPVRIFIRPSGEIANCFCGRCVTAYAERRAIDGAKQRLVRRIGPSGRGKGSLFQQALREDGTPLAILRLACDELVEEGTLKLERGMLRLSG